MKVQKLFGTLLLSTMSTVGFSQVGIGTSTPQAKLDIVANPTATNYSAGDGVLLPRVNEADMTTAAAGENGEIVYNIANNTFYFFNGTNWIDIPSPAAGAAGEVLVSGGVNSSWSRVNTANIENGAVTTDKLDATGTADNTTYLRGDGTWANPHDANIEVRAELSTNTGISNSAPIGTNSGFLRYEALVFNSEITATTAYDEIAGAFTAPESGMYMITVNVESTFNSDGNEYGVGLQLLVNGSVRSEVAHRNTQFTPYRRQISALVYLNMNDVVAVNFGFPETFTNFNDLSAASSYLHIKKL